MLPEIEQFETAYGPIPDELRRVLLERGGLDDLRALWRTQEKYLKEFGPPIGWSMENVFVFAWTAEGEPIAVHRKTGRVVVERRSHAIEVLGGGVGEYSGGVEGWAGGVDGTRGYR